MQSKVKINYIYQIAYKILLVFVPLITMPYISRTIGAEGIGTYSYTYSIVSYFVLFAQLGINTYGVREIAKSRNDKSKLDQVFSELMYAHMGGSFLVLVIYLCVVIFYQSNNKVFFVIQTIYLVAEIFDINWLFFGLEEFGKTVWRNAIVKIATTIAIFTLVKDKGSVSLYCFILAGGMLVSELLLWLHISQYVRFKRVNYEDITKHFKPLFFFFIPSIAASIYTVMDKIMLGHICGMEQSGYYENSEKIISLCMTLITSLGFVMMPHMSELVESGNIYREKDLFKKSMWFASFIGVGLFGGILGVSEVFPTVFWGKGFEQCSVLLQGLALTVPFMSFANVIRTQYLLPHERDGIFICSLVAGAVINLIINSLLIPHFQAIGAVIGTIFAEGSVCIVQAVSVRKEIELYEFYAVSIRFVVISVVMSFVVAYIGRMLGDSMYSLVTQIIVGIFIYLICNINGIRKQFVKK